MKNLTKIEVATEESCETCRFSGELSTKNGRPSKQYRNCRRRAPVARDIEDGTLKGHRTNWPIVMANDWCGEYEKRRDLPIHRNPFKRVIGSWSPHGEFNYDERRTRKPSNG